MPNKKRIIINCPQCGAEIDITNIVHETMRKNLKTIFKKKVLSKKFIKGK